MKKHLYLIFAIATIIGMASCSKEEPTPAPVEPTESSFVYVLNEGGWGMNNASISRIDLKSGTVTNSWFSSVNGTDLGDVGNDIIVTDKYIIAAINGSNIIQFCDLQGKSVAQTEDVPSCRKLAVDGAQEYLYVTSYANDGYVAKIDLSTFKVVGTTNVGYEPEGVACYGSKVYVANSGGYAYTGTHDYEETISVIDAATMKEEKRVKTGLLNLYGAFVQNQKFPRYILVNAAGDYYMNPAGSLIFDCESESVVSTFSFPSTYAAQYDGVFYSIGSSFSYETYSYEYTFRKIDMTLGYPYVSEGLAPVGNSANDGIATAVKNMVAPYGLFITSEGEVFVSDADNYSNRGSVYRFSKDGKQISKETVGVCPGHFAAN